MIWLKLCKCIWIEAKEVSLNQKLYKVYWSLLESVPCSFRWIGDWYEWNLVNRVHSKRERFWALHPSNRSSLKQSTDHQIHWLRVASSNIEYKHNLREQMLKHDLKGNKRELWGWTLPLPKWKLLNPNDLCKSYWSCLYFSSHLYGGRCWKLLKGEPTYNNRLHRLKP